MNKSESIKELAIALSKAQGEMPSVPMESTNPYFKTKYADLGSVIKTAKPVLAKNGLSVSQLITSEESKVGVTTILMHISGEWLSDTIMLDLGEEKGKNISQQAGQVCTYLRRYSYSAILGLYADQDDDGNHPNQKPPEKSLVHEASEMPGAKLVRPYSPAELKRKIAELSTRSEPTTDKDRNFLAAALNNGLAGRSGKPDDLRHSLLRYLIGKSSVKDMSDGEVYAFQKWLNYKQDSGGQFIPDPMAIRELTSTLTEALKADGQQTLV